MQAVIRLSAIAAILFAGVMFVAAQTPSKPTTPPTSQPATQPEPEPIVPLLQSQASALHSFAKSELAQRFLNAAADLPSIQPRRIYRDKTTRIWSSSKQAEAMTDEQRRNLDERLADESLYYQTKYGSPLAYCRPIDLLGQAGLKNIAGKKILDIGYGTIGHLRMMASCGADVVGLDVDSFLTALYSDPSDTGVIKNPNGIAGKITLVDGRLSDDKVKTQVGEKYYLIISKNTLKRGYIHPPAEAKVDKRQLVDLGLDDEAFIRIIFNMLKPGGKFLIYNICPAPAPPDKPYIPWADGRCPFQREALENAGFVVSVFDQDDSEPVRVMARAIGWDKGEQPMDVENDLFAHYTLLEKP